jgi:hypothetical protein
MDNLLSAVLALSFAAGLNTYATVLAVGLLGRFGGVDLPANLRLLTSTPMIALAAVLFIVEFFADKVPLFDTVWDSIHTVIRPAAGAFLSYAAVSNVDPQWQAMAALVGGTIALTSHTAKASARAAVNLRPEPFSNWALSLAEDATSFGLVWLIGAHPLLAITFVLLLTAVALYVIWKLWGFVKRVFRRHE